MLCLAFTAPYCCFPHLSLSLTHTGFYVLTLTRHSLSLLYLLQKNALKKSNYKLFFFQSSFSLPLILIKIGYFQHRASPWVRVDLTVVLHSWLTFRLSTVRSLVSQGTMNRSDVCHRLYHLVSFLSFSLGHAYFSSDYQVGCFLHCFSASDVFASVAPLRPRLRPCLFACYHHLHLLH